MPEFTLPRLETLSIKAASELLLCSESRIRRLIKRGKLTGTNDDGRLAVHRDDNFKIEEESRHENLRDIVVRRHNRRYRPFALKPYHRYHECLDNLTWLLRVFYSDPSQVKRRSFRLDRLYAHFVKQNKIDLSRIKSHLTSADGDVRRFRKALQQGWYNEIAYETPARANLLGISNAAILNNLESSVERYAFPSWRITTAYYSIYFYTRSLVNANTVSYREEEHQASTRVFRASLLDKFQRYLFHYPFNIAFDEMKKGKPICGRFVAAYPSHVRFNYSRHPRSPRPTFVGCEREVYNSFKSAFRENPTRDGKYFIVDLLRDFRNWSTYADIDTILSLRSAGFRTFLDQNLRMLLFIFGGMAELLALSFLGASGFRDLFESFFEEFIVQDKRLWHSCMNLGLIQRLRIHEHVGMIPKGFVRVTEPPNPNVLLLD